MAGTLFKKRRQHIGQTGMENLTAFRKSQIALGRPGSKGFEKASEQGLY